MNLNTFCIRISCTLIIVLVGAFVILEFGEQLLAPIAVCILPNEIADARYANPFVMVSVDLGPHGPPEVRTYQSEISYSGHTATLKTTRSLTAPAHDADSEAAPKFQVRFVRTFPSLVVPHAPGAWLWDYYWDTWTVPEFLGFLFSTSIVVGAGVLFRRHPAGSRRRTHHRNRKW